MPDIPDNVTHIANYLAGKTGGAGPDDTYPLFEGKVICVSGMIIGDQGTLSIIDYFPKDTELPFADPMKLLLNLGEVEAGLEASISRVSVPFAVHPEVLNGAQVKSYFQELPAENGTQQAYILDVIKGPSPKYSTDALTRMTRTSTDKPHTGFKYIRLIE